MKSDSGRAPTPDRRPRRNPRAVRSLIRLDYTLGILLWCLAVAGFVWIAIVVTHGELLPLDAAGLRWARSARSPGLTAAILEITALGSVPTVLLVLLLATVFLPSWSRGGRRSTGRLLLLWLAVIGGAVLNTLLKTYFTRPRPPIATSVHAGFFAFPSGHAMSSMVVYGTLAFLIVRGAPGRTALQTLTIAGAALVIVLVGLSRIYLGVHYATDVLGGYLAGFAWADFCVLAYEVGRGRRGWKVENRK
jgi:undecaprenyl-diphosphatase